MEPTENQVKEAFAAGYTKIKYFVPGYGYRYIRNTDLSQSQCKKGPVLEFTATDEDLKKLQDDYIKREREETLKRVSAEYIADKVKSHFSDIIISTDKSGTGSQYITLSKDGGSFHIRISDHNILSRSEFSTPSARFDFEVIQAYFEKGDEKEIIRNIESELA